MQTSMDAGARLAERQRATMRTAGERLNDDLTCALSGLCEALGCIPMDDPTYAVVVDALAAGRRAAATAHHLVWSGVESVNPAVGERVAP